MDDTTVRGPVTTITHHTSFSVSSFRVSRKVPSTSMSWQSTSTVHIEGSFLVSRTGDTLGRHVPNTYRFEWMDTNLFWVTTRVASPNPLWPPRTPKNHDKLSSKLSAKIITLNFRYKNKFRQKSSRHVSVEAVLGLFQTFFPVLPFLIVCLYTTLPLA